MKRFLALIFALCVMGGMVSCGGDKVPKEVKAVQEKIAELPTAYSDDADSAMRSAREAYDALSDDDKSSVDISVLEKLEDEKYKSEADEINNEISSLDIKSGSYSELSNSRNGVSNIMEKIGLLSEGADKYIDYDELQKKIDVISNKYHGVLVNLDNDAKAFNDLYNALDSINRSSKKSMKYSYACDVESAVSKLSSLSSTVKSNLSTPVSELKNACLYGEDFDISIAVVHVIEAAPTDGLDKYADYLEDTSISDDCLKWKQVILGKINS